MSKENTTLSTAQNDQKVWGCALGKLPRLRFPEFRGSGDWEEKSLISVCQMQAGKFVPASKIYETLEDNLHPCYGGNGLRGFTKTYTNIGRYSLIGRQGALCGNVTLVSGKFHATEHAVVTTPTENTDADWLYFLLNFLNLNQYATGQAQPGLSVKNLEEIIVKIPSDKTEQQKIANCLTSLDQLITTHAQKLDTLKAHKKGLMQQLFPAEGKIVPNYRFPEFRDAGDWEGKPISKLLTIGSGRDYKHLTEGDIPVYGTGGYMLSVNDYLYDGESVCIGRKGTIDKPVFLTGKFWTVDTLFYTHSFNGCLPKFIYSCFQNINWKNHNEAGGVPSLSKVIINKIEIKIPSPEEQQKIADCFTSLDQLITTQVNKINTLKAHKKGLMQQLFPATNDNCRDAKAEVEA